MGGEWSLAVALVMECWPERHRSKLAGIIGAACNVGFLFIALVAMQWQVTVHSWRWMMLVGASPAILALLIIFFVPESERWKAAAKKGGRSPLLEIFAPGIRSKTILAMIVAGIPLLGTWAAVSAYIPGWVDDMAQTQAAKGKLSPEELKTLESLTTRVERKTFLKESLTDEERRAVISESARAKASVQLMMAIGAIIACIAASELGRKFGRRPVYCMLCLLSFLSSSYLFWFWKEYDWKFMIMAFIVGGITAAFYGWLPLYLPELFPTRIRATGQGLSFNFGRILAAVGTLCLGQFFAFFGNDYGKAMGTVALVYLVGMVVIWFGPETKGKPLPE
jgi:MFS family permease